jgi:hypothetical protein
MPGDGRRKVALALFVALQLTLAGGAIYVYWNPAALTGFVESGIRSGPDRRERCTTKVLVHGVAIAGAMVAFNRRSLGLGLVAASYLVEAARFEVFHVREGGRLFDADFLAPWLMMFVSLFFGWTAFIARQREEARTASEEVH